MKRQDPCAVAVAGDGGRGGCGGRRRRRVAAAVAGCGRRALAEGARGGFARASSSTVSGAKGWPSIP
eukprot:9474661-Pyramimonas_sp.AAC.1